MIICILGRQPKIGLAELESLYGNKVRSCGNVAALVDVSSVSQKQLGGTMKAAQLLETLPQTTWSDLITNCEELLHKLISDLPEGKIKLGLSVYGLKVNSKQLQRAGLELKKSLRSQGRSVRVIPNTSLELNSAQVLHNKLDESLGIELIFVEDGNKIHIGRTMSVQDIDDYAKRDFGRPKRDPFVGMLPPKLAQIMINLTKPEPNSTILDPFCGTGVVLMEAALQNYSIQGTDLNPKMIDYTKANLAWLAQTYHLEPKIKELSEADAQKHRWQQPIGSVVCETYLGQPLSGLPKPEKLREIIDNCDRIVQRFLENLRLQLESGARCCIAVPAWRVQNRFLRLPVLDYLEKIGYNQVSFSQVSENDLIYHRADQIVARQLLVITRK